MEYLTVIFGTTGTPTWTEKATTLFNNYQYWVATIGGLLAIIMGIMLDRYFARVFKTAPIEPELPKQESNDSSDDESDEYVYAPGKSTLEIIEIYTKVLEKFPDIADAKLASGGLPDVLGYSTSDVDLIIVTDKINGFENTFGNNLIQIKAPSETKPYRCVYTIRLEGYNRDINIYATTNPTNTNAITHRDNEILLNQYQNLQQVAIWHKMFGKNANGDSLSTEEAWAVTLCLQGDPYDRMAQSNEKIKAIADLMEPELQNAFLRV